MKKIITLAFLLLQFQLFAAKYIRYNQSGYELNRPKKLFVIADENCSGIAWSITNATNQSVLSGTLTTSMAAAGSYTPKAFNHLLDISNLNTNGVYTLTVTGIAPVKIIVKDRNHAALVHSILKTIRARRSGSADAYLHGISHLGDSSSAVFERTGTNNGTWAAREDALKVNMVGGYYDAGDYIKFTTTTSYLTYHLLRAYEEAPELFDGVKKYSKTALDDLLDECKWGLEYLSKTNPQTGIFIIQVGGAKDHNQGTRLPENDALNGKRESYSNLSRPQMGTTIAALALGSKVFADKGLSLEATTYKNMAIQIYLAAKAATGTPAWCQGGGAIFYKDASIEDNMGLAAIELYRLTNVASYLSDAKAYALTADAGYWSAWGNLNILLNNRIVANYPAAETALLTDLDNFNTNASQTGNIWGLPHESVWGSLYSQLSVASNAILYKQFKKSTTIYDNFAYNVTDYLFGTNNWGLSFLAHKKFTTGITTSYAQIYKLNALVFPEGELAEGPSTAAEHTGEEGSFSPVHNANLWHKEFNTSLFTFFEEPGDYVCMETTIAGLGDALLFLTLSSKAFSADPSVLALNSFAGVNNNGVNTITYRYGLNSYVPDTLYFEKSTDSLHFTNLNKSLGTQLSFTENNTNLKTFYRFYYYDGNGIIKYSNVIVVNKAVFTGFELFPNPFASETTLKEGLHDLKNGSEASVEVIDLAGKLVQSFQLKSNVDCLFGNDLPKGIYMLKITKNNTVQYLKIIKENGGL